MTPLELVRQYIEERGFQRRLDIWSQEDIPMGNYYSEFQYDTFQLRVMELINVYGRKTAINFGVARNPISVDTYENEADQNGDPQWDCKITTYIIDLHSINAFNLISKIVERDGDASDGWVLEGYPGAGL